MELGKILEFRRDLYFEGAVQADWFYSQEKAAKVAENFVFHGKQYFGVEDQDAGKKRIDTISLVEELTEKMSDDHANILDDTMQVTSIIYLLIWKRFLLT